VAWLSDRRPDAEAGLLPVAVQDADSGELLMLAYANREALEASERTGEAHFWSRSRDELWRKGATSGNAMALVDISTDCDGDAVRYRVRPAGPACHTGTRSCFPDAATQSGGELARLARVVEQRRGADPDTSYTARLLEGGPRRPAEKVSEEAGELVVAALAGSDDDVREEAADLLYHVLVLLAAREITLAEVEEVLASRRR
jgi:phosphoribosyl-ATP pyrophosphohydrolase/phosphoribosyl-AMP cyclohydrolase